MGGSTARLEAINAVKAYEPPAVSFTSEETPGEIFGENVFSKAVMQKRLPKAVYKSVMATIEHSEAARPERRRRRRRRDEGLGDGEGRDALRARLLPADRPHRREARQLPRARRRRLVDRRVRRQDPDPGRAGRLELPERRPAQHVRGPRLHRLGRHQPGVHPREPQRQHAVHPDGLRLDDRRGARPQDAAAALAAGDGRAGRAGAAAVRPRETRRGRVVRRRRAGVLPDRPAASSSPAPTCSTPAARCSAPSRPRARSSTTTTSGRSPSACSRFMLDCERELFKLGIPAKTRHNEVAPGPVRDRADVRAVERRRRPPAAADGDAQAHRQQARHGVPVPREAVRRASTARASTSTSRWATRPRATCCCRATPRTTTPSSSSSAPR